MACLVVLGCSKDDEGGVTPPVEPPVEGEAPVAVDDEVETSENTELVIRDLLDNDTVVDYARITGFDSTTEEGGEVMDNRNGTYTYTPPQDFTGKDSFEYTICDNADKPNCSTATVLITVTAASPVAVDDAYQTEEEKTLIITNYLANDDLADNSTVASVDATGSSGSVSLSENGNIQYVPADGFTGEDSFTYTLCDDDGEPTCETAMITVTVVDEGSPVAKDDAVNVQLDATAVVLDDLLENDAVIDDAVITSVGSASAGGTVVLNDDNSISYTPQVGFTGQDSFTYTLCDDDTPDATCSTATVNINVVEAVSFSIPSALQDYYSSVVFLRDENQLFGELVDVTIDQHVNLLEYTQRHDYLYDADASLSDPDYVVLMYTGEVRPDDEFQVGDLDGNESFNTEHIFPQSLLVTQEAKNDLHHMRVADAAVNSLRLNFPFTTGSGEAKLVGGDEWYPGDEWIGDVARMVMYVHLRHGEPFSDVGTLQMFLEWNAQDPVSDFERQRQEVIEGAQGNRNPFIDNPYLATLLWGGPDAENLWD